MVPLATPARLATSSSRVAVKPRATNSSSAASMMAWRRSAARAARLDGDLTGSGKAGFGAWTEAVFFPIRRLAGFGAAMPKRRVREFAMGPNMTDRSVIVNRNSSERIVACRYLGCRWKNDHCEPDERRLFLGS